MSDFFDYTEGKMSDRERHAFERRMQKDPFESDAAEGFSRVSREEAEQDLHFAAGSIHSRIEGAGSRSGSNRRIAGAGSRSGSNRRIAGAGSRAKRNRRIAWYSAAAAIASLMIVTTVFFRLNDNGLERFETAPEMREAAREQSAKKRSVPQQEADVEQEEPAGEDGMEQEKPLGEDAMEQEEPAGEDGMGQEKMVQKDGANEESGMKDAGVQKNGTKAAMTKKISEQGTVSEEAIEADAAFPVTAAQDAKKGYDLEEMQKKEKRQILDQEANNMAKELPDVDEEVRQSVEEDHAFAWEKMEEEAAAGRYSKTEQRMAPPEAVKEPTTAYDLQTPTAAKDNVRQELKVADISPQPARTVSGVVRSADDLEPLPGAVVRLKDSETGTVADLEGRFTLDVTTDDEEALEVSYIGMKTEEVPATTDQPVEIALVPDEISLDEVVVIGYGGSKKSQLTASTTAVEAEPSGTVNFESAVPVNGIADFRSYIDSTLVYPEPTEISGKEVVVLKFSVSPEGRPQNFRVIRAPDNEAFEKEAIRAVLKGPAWQPATKNGQHTDEEVRLRIVFKKD